MILSTHTEILPKKFGYEETVKLYAKTGFDAYDATFFDMKEPNFYFEENYREKALNLRKTADENNILCNQAHAPFPMHRDGDPSWDKKMLGYAEKSLEISSILGAKVCVVHPWNSWEAEENVEKIYLPLKETADKFHVKIGVENMWNRKDGRASAAACSSPDDFVKHMELLPKDTFTACLDIGHAEMFEGFAAPDFIYALNERLGALHVHDNDRIHDLHYFPYMGTIDWEKICKALADIDYKGDFTLESDHTFLRYPENLIPELLPLLEKTGRTLISKIEGYRSK